MRLFLATIACTIMIGGNAYAAYTVYNPGAGQSDTGYTSSASEVVASDSDAIPDWATWSNADLYTGPGVYSSYGSVYDGSISTTILQYFKDVAYRLPVGTDYVFWRNGQYDYRLVYGDIIMNGNNFSGSSCNYYSYNSNNATFNGGLEGNFSLNTGGRLVYTSLAGKYPALIQGVNSNALDALLFVAVLGLLLGIVRTFYQPGGGFKI